MKTTCRQCEKRWEGNFTLLFGENPTAGIQVKSIISKKNFFKNKKAAKSLPTTPLQKKKKPFKITYTYAFVFSARGFKRTSEAQKVKGPKEVCQCKSSSSVAPLLMSVIEQN